MNKETMGMMITSKRKGFGMTQLDLAEKMGVTDKAVSKWERDLSYPDVNSLPKLAEILGTTVDELLQNRTGTSKQENHMSATELVPLILRAVCLAMGVAVVVLSVIGKIDTKPAITMLGIGLACVGMSLIERTD